MPLPSWNGEGRHTVRHPATPLPASAHLHPAHRSLGWHCLLLGAGWRGCGRRGGGVNSLGILEAVFGRHSALAETRACESARTRLCSAGSQEGGRAVHAAAPRWRWAVCGIWDCFEPVGEGGGITSCDRGWGRGSAATASTRALGFSSMIHRPVRTPLDGAAKSARV